MYVAAGYLRIQQRQLLSLLLKELVQDCNLGLLFEPGLFAYFHLVFLIESVYIDLYLTSFSKVRLTTVGQAHVTFRPNHFGTLYNILKRLLKALMLDAAALLLSCGSRKEITLPSSYLFPPAVQNIDHECGTCIQESEYTLQAP